MPTKSQIANMLDGILQYADAIVIDKGELVEKKASMVLNAIEAIKKSIDNELCEGN
jgi:hypothetical protein